MRYLMIVLAMAFTFAPPAAAQSALVPYSLTFSGTYTQGTINGEWGGMFVRGAYGGGRWALISGGRIVVDGTYRCDVGCTFDASVDYAIPTRVALYVETLMGTESTGTVSGSLPLNLRPPTLVP